jgi:hypothetical protein
MPVIYELDDDIDEHRVVAMAALPLHQVGGNTDLSHDHT